MYRTHVTKPKLRFQSPVESEGRLVISGNGFSFTFPIYIYIEREGEGEGEGGRERGREGGREGGREREREREREQSHPVQYGLESIANRRGIEVDD
jgi:hypothetical protein